MIFHLKQIFSALLLFHFLLNPSIFASLEFFSSDELIQADVRLSRDLALLNYPGSDWINGQQPDANCAYDVAIIGGGMAGLAAGAALLKEGIFHIKIFDENDQGVEGPWVTYARMRTLRTPKDLIGPALEIPHLTFRAWYESMWGEHAWNQLGKIPNRLWMEYLTWYRKTMRLPVENDCRLTDVLPSDKGFELWFQHEGQHLVVHARKVVLATGRTGFGGPQIPAYIKQIPKSYYAHTMENIDFNALREKRLCVIGVGASAFDAAATALENGVRQVDMMMRRCSLPCVNKFANLYFKGILHGFCKLCDEKRLEYMSEAFASGEPPPVDALLRIENYPNLKILANREIKQVNLEGSDLRVVTSNGTFVYDFIILGTGYVAEGRLRHELRHIYNEIALWKDKVCHPLIYKHPKLGNYPYLGSIYEFLPKTPGQALYLKDIYCFNDAAKLSHGMLSSGITAISFGATRLAQGIAADIFLEKADEYINCLRCYEMKLFKQEAFNLNIE